MRNEPPICFADSVWNEESRLLNYTYNERNLISIQVPGTAAVDYRGHSDAMIQSDPCTQQLFVTLDVEEPMMATVIFTLSEDAVVMRPHRARAEQAVLGQVGRPTISGVNGVYDILDDLLMSWHGQEWCWLDKCLGTDENGNVTVAIEVALGKKPWIINVFPRYYSEHLGYTYHKPWESRPKLDPVAGWCSWEAYYRDITEKKILEAADFAAENFKDYGLSYIQMDDGYQEVPIIVRKDPPLKDAWLKRTEDFPSGLESLCDNIKAQGLLPGVWVSAAAQVGDPEEEDAESLLTDENGKPVAGNWIPRTFDCLPTSLERHIRPLYDGLRACGFKYIKTDQIRHLLYDSLQAEVLAGRMTNDEVRRRFREFLAATVEAAGPDVFTLASWGVLSEVVGLFDGCRIAIDANPQWQRVRMQIIESARWFHTQRILFLNDPDHICARTKPEWSRSLTSLVSLSGGLFMISDAIDTYDDERVNIIQRSLPPLGTAAAETGPLDMHYPAFTWTKQHGAAFKVEIETAWDEVSDDFARLAAGEQETMDADHPLSSLWSVHFSTDAGCWAVAGRFATLPLRESVMALKNLGLSSDVEYLAFDFWEEKFLGEVKESVSVPAVSLGDSQIIAFREKLDHPQFLASTRHISMGAIDIDKQEWTDDGMLKLDINGMPGKEEIYWLHVPTGWSDGAVAINGAKVKEQTVDGTVMKFILSFTEKNVSLAVSFKS
jgi:hypothetical protein